MLERITFENREEWLAGRLRGIGGSEAAAACGMSPWMTPMELWRLKCGAEKPKDLSDNAAVQQGVRMEPALRSFFQATHPELRVDYHQFDILYQSDRPWLFATLDGEIEDDRLVDTKPGTMRLVNKTTGETVLGSWEGKISVIKHGILEIKTATPNGKAGWAKWADGAMPQNYYIQILHQLLATGYDFAYLFAALYSMNGDITLREYEIQRADVESDLKWLLDKETEFWRHCEDGTLPSMPLTL